MNAIAEGVVPPFTATLQGRNIFAEDTRGLKLDLGCGSRKQPGFTGVDIGGNTAADVQMDVLECLRNLRDNSVDEIYSRHYMEHVEPRQFGAMMREINRVLSSQGRARIIVPHYSNPYFYSDPTHRLPFGVHTFSYVCESSCLERQVPKYASIAGLRLIDVKVRFEGLKRPRLLGIRLPVLSDFLNPFVNRSHRAIERFERYFAGVFSIYEVSFTIEKS